MKLKISVHGVAYEVEVEVLDLGQGFTAPSAVPQMSSQHPVPAPPGGAGAAPRPAAAQPVILNKRASDHSSVTSPIAGNVVEIKAKVGDEVNEGDVILVIEAMKMNTSIAAPGHGKIKKIEVAVGDAIREGQILAEFE